MKKILITGGFGMIGRRLVRKLKNKENKVLVLDNFLSKLQPINKINYQKIDISNKKKLLNIFKKFQPEIVIHLAAIHHIPTCEKKRSYAQKINILSTENLLHFSEVFKVKKFILASSGAVYDWSNTKLIENQSKILPRDNYSLCKFSNEIQLKLWTQRTNGIGIVARIFNSIGFDDPNSHLLPDILKQIDHKKKNNNIVLGNLKPRRDYIDASDVASALKKMIKFNKNNYEIFNICNGKEYSVLDVVNVLENILSTKINVTSIKSKKRKIDRLSQIGSNKKTIKTLKWKPKFDFKQTLKKYVIEKNFNDQ
tara:strand:- start:300 stop:1229 length:930 start_codon:yes stop_codon:yes gene_type:complete